MKRGFASILRSGSTFWLPICIFRHTKSRSQHNKELTFPCLLRSIRKTRGRYVQLCSLSLLPQTSQLLAIWELPPSFLARFWAGHPGARISKSLVIAPKALQLISICFATVLCSGGETDSGKFFFKTDVFQSTYPEKLIPEIRTQRAGFSSFRLPVKPTFYL